MYLWSGNVQIADSSVFAATVSYRPPVITPETLRLNRMSITFVFSIRGLACAERCCFLLLVRWLQEPATTPSHPLLCRLIPPHPATCSSMDSFLIPAPQSSHVRTRSNTYASSHVADVCVFSLADGPPLQTCTVVVALSTSETITCTTAPRGSGLLATFTVSVPGQSVTGTDTISFPVLPYIYAVSGCVDVLNATIDCPTEGGIPLTITGYAQI